jgi:hypothetical protein
MTTPTHTWAWGAVLPERKNMPCSVRLAGDRSGKVIATFADGVSIKCVRYALRRIGK